MLDRPQNSVTPPILIRLLGAGANISCSFIAIKPDGVQVLRPPPINSQAIDPISLRVD